MENTFPVSSSIILILVHFLYEAFISFTISISANDKLMVSSFEKISPEVFSITFV